MLFDIVEEPATMSLYILIPSLLVLAPVPCM